MTSHTPYVPSDEDRWAMQLFVLLISGLLVLGGFSVVGTSLKSDRAWRKGNQGVAEIINYTSNMKQEALGVSVRFRIGDVESSPDGYILKSQKLIGWTRDHIGAGDRVDVRYIRRRNGTYWVGFQRPSMAPKIMGIVFVLAGLGLALWYRRNSKT